MYFYVVRATFKAHATFEAYVAWLASTHVREVCEAGGCDGEIRLREIAPGTRLEVESHYRFTSRQSWKDYEQSAHCTRLRAAAIAELDRLGARVGDDVTFERVTSTGVVWK
jgi:hypothetical protein